MTIIDEMVEVAARDVCFSFYGTQWDATSLFRQGLSRDMARAALEAVAPMIRAAALDEAARVAEVTGVYPELNVSGGGPEWYRHGKNIAAAIRKLKETAK